MEELMNVESVKWRKVSTNLFTFGTFDCLAASNWPPGHPCSDHHVNNPHRPDHY